jgi:hypothetical protein
MSKAVKTSVDEIDLDILGGESVAAIPAGKAKQALAAATETHNQNELLSKLSETTEASQRDLVNQLLGQAQAAAAFSQISQTIGVSKLAYVKETKLYKALKGMKPNGLELSGTWEEFCELLGMSDEKANQDIANLHAFGEDALKMMSSMGIGYRELRQYRKLPADQRTALIEVAKTGDKDDLLELAEDLLDKERATQAELAAQNADLTKRSNVLERELEKTDSEFRRYKDKMVRQVGKAVFADRTGMVREEALAYQLEGQIAIDSLVKLFDEVMCEPDKGDAEWHMRIGFISMQIKSIHARSLVIMDMIVDAGAPVEYTLGEHFLSVEEAKTWLADAELIAREQDARRQQREDMREAEKPKGRGRPEGSKNKSKAVK